MCEKSYFSQTLYCFCEVLVMTCLQRYTSITSIDTRTPPPPIHPDRQSWWLLRWFGCDHFANQLPLGLDTTRRPPSSSRARAGGGVPTTTPAMIIRSQTGAQLLVVPCSAPCLGGVFGDVHHHWSSRFFKHFYKYMASVVPRCCWRKTFWF